MLNISDIKTNFNTFTQNNPSWITDLHIQGTGRFRGIECNFKGNTYTFILDSDDGEFFIDCPKKHLFIKHILLIFYSIPHMICSICSNIPDRTLELADNIYNGSPFLKHSFSVIKAPFSTVAIVSLAIFGVIGTVFGFSNTLYFTQKWIGRIQLWQYSVTSYSEIDSIEDSPIANCMIPYHLLEARTNSNSPAISDIKSMLSKKAESNIAYILRSKENLNTLNLLQRLLNLATLPLSDVQNKTYTSSSKF